MWKVEPRDGLLVHLGEPCGPLGFVAVEAGPGRAVWEYTVASAHLNPNGVLHGGITMALIDTAMGHAVAEIVYRQGRRPTAAQMNVNFLAPVRDGRLRVDAVVVKAGKRLTIVDGRVTDQAGTLVANASGTYAIIPWRARPADRLYTGMSKRSALKPGRSAPSTPSGSRSRSRRSPGAGKTRVRR